ncbi:glycoside hydrolase family 43 protein [Succinivibrio sp.]|uniref:glycoside hydrolase family 43 protein n=1 Tax=Succinivibrio sp. TaxID=2053619 RepID=UPI0025DDF20F|nr:glycoside hydrolase family 43 protein [Succinivibrio sp.]MBQ9219874.1 glycoside hydrolase family 43 protein [Succinivibrio sp.]
MKPRYLFPKDFMADPSANVFNGRMYVYPSHDYDSGAAFDDDGGHFQMRDYHVLSMDDVMNGEVTDHGVILDVDDVPWAEKQMWDNDVVEKNGKYYLVFSAKDYNGVFHLGVAVSDKPEGPFKSEPAPIIGSYSIDPCVFKDDDGEVYCYFGGLWGGQLQWYRNNKLKPAASVGEENFNPTLLPSGKEDSLPSRVVRMSEDMLQFAEEPKPVVIVDEKGETLKADDPHRFFEASWMFKRNGTYYFTYSTGDSHYLCYTTADNPYGPFTYQGVILEPVCGWTTHHSITEYKGQWYLFHHDCQPSEGKDWLRSLKVMPLEFDAQGKIKTMRSE